VVLLKRKVQPIKWISLSQLLTCDILSTEHWVEHDGIKLYLLEKSHGNLSSKPIVVLAHGSATAGRESFDLQVPGKPSYSLMDFLAGEGFDVFTLDIRGFGRSAHLKK